MNLAFRRATVGLLSLGLAGALVACATGAAPSNTAAPTRTPAATPTGPAQHICRFTDNGGGTYYLLLTNAAHPFVECPAGGTFLGGTLDDLFNTVAGLDRRCILDSNAALATFDAIVAVYSDTKRADLAAARAFCAANGGAAL